MKKLSPDMKKVLLKIIDNTSIENFNTNTIQGLYLRKLIDGSIQLTREGWILAISFLKLDKQCKYLGIEFEELVIEYANLPEIAALNYYESIWYTGTYAEGGAILI